MEVILKEDVANLGHRGDVVKVADGYGRNFLLPRKLALQATLANKAVIEQMKAAAARRSATEKAQAEELVAKLQPIELSFTRKSGENGQLFGSVTSADIAGGLEAKGFEVDRRKIQLTDPLKSLGEYTVAIKLHREVTAHVKVQVAAEAQEAPARAREGRSRRRVVQAETPRRLRVSPGGGCVSGPASAVAHAGLRRRNPMLRTGPSLQSRRSAQSAA